MAKEIQVAPKRIVPGELFVTRTFGAAGAKLPELGGNPKAVTALPEISTLHIRPSHSFVVLGTSGVFSALSNTEAARCVTAAARYAEARLDVCAKAAECIVKSSLARGSVDSATAVVIAFGELGKTRRRKRSVSVAEEGGGEELSARLPHGKANSLARAKLSNSCQLLLNSGYK